MSIQLNFPALYASHGAIWFAREGEPAERISRGEAIGRAAETPLIMLNAPLVAQRIGYPECSGLDVLELFAFIHPARFMVPTPAGLARTLGLDISAGQDSDHTAMDEAEIAPMLLEAVRSLLAVLHRPDWAERDGAWRALQSLARKRWPWAQLIQQHLQPPAKPESWLFAKLPEWQEAAPRPRPRDITPDGQAVLDRLDRLIGKGGEQRTGQRDYSRAVSGIFAPRQQAGHPHMLLAEAGTGIGKTQGYLAPAAMWCEESGGSVWISTYTRALQRQLSRETQRICRDRDEFRRRVVVRKGRENYLCLLNLEDALQGGFSGRAAIFAELIGRWAAYSRDGDMIGGDLPGWLVPLFRRSGVSALSDRRGECIFAACPHYRRCFIERSARASQQADIVIANHALMMVNAARGREEAASRIIFDEGHHLFEAADSMFSIAFTGQEVIEMRRWIMGPERGSRGRRRGLAARLADIASYDEKAGKAIQAARDAATLLPGEGWLTRVCEGDPLGPVETLFTLIRTCVYARNSGSGQDKGARRKDDPGYGLESELVELDGDFIDAAMGAAEALDALYAPLVALGKRLEQILADPPDWLDGQGRARLEGAGISLGWRCDMLAAWAALLGRIGGPGDPDFIDWMALDRYDGREFDMGLHRHWVDPCRALAETVLKPAHGVLVTSATLRAGGEWSAAQLRSGAVHLERPAGEFSAASPFDYASQSEVLIVTDIKRGDLSALAAGYARLIEASGGGALGLFSAIRRLRFVYGRIAGRLAEAGLPLYAQHVDPIETGTLVDIFRDDPRASILGTDSLRDGVDVPGHSLRLVIMEGVPWPRPDILHRARRAAFGGSTWDDMIIRARLAQAFGRLIRRRDDHGQFVVLSPAFPSRLLSAFPEATPVRRVTLDEALQAVQTAANRDADSNPAQNLIREG